MASWLAAGCGDNGDGDSPQEFGTAQVRLEAMSSTNTMANQLEFEDPSGTLYSMTSLTIAVEELEFDLPANISCGDIGGEFDARVQCDDDGALGGEDQIKIDGPFVFNVLEGTSTPDLSTIRIPAIGYTTVDLEVDTARIEDNTVPRDADIIDHTVVAFSDFEFMNSKRELMLDFSFKAEAKASADDLPQAAVADGGTLVLQLDVANWLDSIPVTDCLMAGSLKSRDGLVTLDDEAIDDCGDAEAQFESNFEDSLRLKIEPPPETM
ncbi:hypothetical protein FIV42_12930 [Persicimonas caeni]|uniref:DUF4382 domain-containing protein n=1 Tax=Persicimonas caeni TaxID=2292766 RepID=A0A4Y6PTJ2_PERCE|nr:hypothetical protein [Persicimonas caeni]QDG51618.1 hypothetical protein FIV42_12930 [Persicimonas caeni]QED32839.1 hypothetical protein FRD00_12925 [Persicimonas caeni]